MAPEDEGLSLKAELAARQAFLEEIQGRMELRRRFLEKQVTALEVEIHGRLAEAEKTLKAASARVEELQVKLTELSLKASLGLVPPGEVRALQAELESTKAVMKLASIEKTELLKVR